MWALTARVLAVSKTPFFAPSRTQQLTACAGAKTYPIRELKSLQEIEWPETFPFSDPKYFSRTDESSDDIFYEQPRFVTHIDDNAIASLTHYYSTVMRDGDDVCDICSSWVSHLPAELKLGRVAGLGMNGQELSRNSQLTEFAVQDLNVDPALPYESESFDFACNVVSVDYLNKPLDIFGEMHRILRPGGTAIMSFSNRCFPTKAVAVWGQTDDSGHIWIVGSYFKFSAEWSSIKAFDISTGKGDPMFIVQGTK